MKESKSETKKLTKTEPKAKPVMWPINRPLDESDDEPINEPKPKPKSSKEIEEEHEYNKLMRRFEKFKDDRLQQNMEDERDELMDRFKAFENKDEKLQQQIEEENDEIIGRLSRLNKVIIDDKIDDELLDPDYELYYEIQDMEINEVINEPEAKFMMKKLSLSVKKHNKYLDFKEYVCSQTDYNVWEYVFLREQNKWREYGFIDG